MVYVDDMRAEYGRMTMCHMVADSSAELHEMADRIGVARRWCQYPNRPEEHYDIALSKRALAVRAGAREVTWRQVGARQILLRAGIVPGCIPEAWEPIANALLDAASPVSGGA